MELWDVVVIAAALFSPNSNEGENGHTYAVGQLEQSSSNEIAENIDGIFNPVISNRIAVIESAYQHGVANGHNSPAEQVKQSRSKVTDENIDKIFSPVLANRIAATKVANASTANRFLGPSDYEVQTWLNDTLNERGRRYTLLRLSRHRVYLLMKRFDISHVLSCTPRQVTKETDWRAVNYSCSFSIYHMELEVIYQIHNTEKYRKLQTISMQNMNGQAIIKSDKGTLEMVVISLGDKYEAMTKSKFVRFLPGLLGSSPLGEREKAFIFYLALNSDGDTLSVLCCDADGFIRFERLGSV
ncbi:hypothetical protein SprV_0902712300 [Sparganum proliferum]